MQFNLRSLLLLPVIVAAFLAGRDAKDRLDRSVFLLDRDVAIKQQALFRDEFEAQKRIRNDMKLQEFERAKQKTREKAVEDALRIPFETTNFPDRKF
ncbi:MAG: hypothetical protein SGI77_10155 [Pirellulaceae bacterium]|nr:hypothetical protein [Pirellulaceae bacterium]